MAELRPADGLAGLLRRLLSEGSVPDSSLSGRSRRRLAGLLESGVLRRERSGAGFRVVVESTEHLQRWIRHQYPSGLMVDEAAGRERAGAVAALRDSHRASVPHRCPVLLRGFGEVALKSESGTCPVAELTDGYGVAALVVGADCGWSWEGRLAVVENMEVFLRFEELGLKVPLVAYAAGRMHSALLGWLASGAMRKARVLHFGDYDPVGLDEYLRLREACPGRAELYLPDGLERLFARYSKPGLLRGTEAVLRRLRDCGLPEVRRVVDLMDRHGAGLEQEALLLECPSDRA